MLTTDLIREAMALPIAERAELSAMLAKSVAREYTPSFKGRAGFLAGIVAEVFGYEIPAKGRRADYVFGRWLIASELRREGYTLHAIADEMACHYTNVIHTLQSDFVLSEKENKQKTEFYKKLLQKSQY